MENPTNEGDIDFQRHTYARCATEIFDQISRGGLESPVDFIEIFGQISRRGLERPVDFTITDFSINPDVVPLEGVQHLISAVDFKPITQVQWQLACVWDNVDISRLDNIPLDDEYYEWFSPPLYYRGQNNLRVMMAENINFILLRTMLECNHQNGHRVRSLQIVWSGNFADYNRALEVLRGNNSALFDNLIVQVFDCHMRHQVVAANLSLPTIVISDNHTDDPCTVCLENFEIGETANSLNCNHIYHNRCISRWLSVGHTCPTCRRVVR